MKTLMRMVKGGVKGFLPFYLLAFLPFLASCSEQDDTVEEYPDWQATNDAYFSQLVSQAGQQAAAGSAQWLLLPRYTMPAETNATPAYSDYVVVEQLAAGSGTTSPYLTDSVEVHYVGRLLPSATHPAGLDFDRTYKGDFDPALATPVKFAAKSLVVGFTTALLSMHRGDHWRVYIPYQLAYGTAASG